MTHCAKMRSTRAMLAWGDEGPAGRFEIRDIAIYDMYARVTTRARAGIPVKSSVFFRYSILSSSFSFLVCSPSGLLAHEKT